MTENTVLTKLLDLAVELIQTRGYNAFSYRDLSREIGIKTSSIHYYFPSKEDLGKAAMARYRENFNQSLSRIDSAVQAPTEKLMRFSELASGTLKSCDKICLGGMLASDFHTMPDSIREQVRGFYNDNEAWITKVLKSGCEQAVFNFEETPEKMAQAIFALLEGAIISARIFKDESRFHASMNSINALLTSKP